MAKQGDRRSRRTPGEGGIRPRGKGSWEIKFDIGPDPATGERVTRYRTVKGTKKDALAELARFQREAKEGTLVEPSKLTVAGYLQSWLTDHAQHRVSAKTFERYAEIVNKHLIPNLGANTLAKLSALQIQVYYSKALTTPRRRTKRGGAVDELAPLSAHTIRHHHRVLSQALKHATRLRLIARNPAADVDAPKPAYREMKIIDQAQTARLIQAIEAAPTYIPVLIAATTGMRRGEILALRWSDIDLEAGVLSVAQTLEETRKRLAFKQPKSRSGRRQITLPAMTIAALASHRTQQKKDKLKAGRAYSDGDLVCCDALGHPFRPHYVTQAVGKLAKRLGLAIRLHGLRHSHISHLLAGGVNPKVLQERAGHASIKITLDTYSHLMPGMQRDAADKTDQALQPYLTPKGSGGN